MSNENVHVILYILSSNNEYYTINFDLLILTRQKRVKILQFHVIEAQYFMLLKGEQVLEGLSPLYTAHLGTTCEGQFKL